MCARNAHSNGYCEDHDQRAKCVYPGCIEFASKDANLCQPHITISIKTEPEPEPEPATKNTKSDLKTKTNKADQKSKAAKPAATAATTTASKKKNEKDYSLYVLGAMIVVICLALFGDKKYAIPLAVVAVLLSILLFLTL